MTTIAITAFAAAIIVGCLGVWIVKIIQGVIDRYEEEKE